MCSSLNVLVHLSMEVASHYKNSINSILPTQKKQRREGTVSLILGDCIGRSKAFMAFKQQETIRRRLIEDSLKRSFQELAVLFTGISKQMFVKSCGRHTTFKQMESSRIYTVAVFKKRREKNIISWRGRERNLLSTSSSQVASAPGIGLGTGNPSQVLYVSGRDPRKLESGTEMHHEPRQCHCGYRGPIPVARIELSPLTS